MHLLTEMVDSGAARFIAARHEAAAVAMADGYARASGKPGVCSVTHGPGLTQTGTPLTAARLARSPVVLIAGDTPRAFRLHVQNIDQEPFALATAGVFQPVRLPETLAEDVLLAFRHVRLGRGPIVLDVGIDLQLADQPLGWQYTPAATTLAPLQRIQPDPERVAAVARLLASSKRPVILAGRGAVEAGARDILVRLADRTGALLATSLLANGWFRGHPFDAGIAGGLGTDLAQQLFAEADCVLIFGASFNRFTSGSGALFPNARLVQIDLDSGRIGDVTKVHDAVIGDAAATAGAIVTALGDSPPASGYRTPELAGRLAGYRAFDEDEFHRGDDGADPREVALICDELLPSPRALVVGIGHYSGYPAVHVGVEDPRAIVLPWQLGSVGLGLPAAIGVAVARPDLTTVVFEGDGGLMMSLPELETAVRCNVPLVVIVLDDSACGAEYHLLASQKISTSLTTFDNPDFIAVGRSLGADAYEARTAGELRAVLNRLGPIRKPTLIRVQVTRQVVHHEMFRALRPS